MNTSDLINRLRKTGLTQGQIAAAIGVSQATISDVSRGKIGNARPSFKLVDGIRRLALERGVVVDADESSKSDPEAA